MVPSLNYLGVGILLSKLSSEGVRWCRGGTRRGAWGEISLDSTQEVENQYQLGRREAGEAWSGLFSFETDETKAILSGLRLCFINDAQARLTKNGLQYQGSSPHQANQSDGTAVVWDVVRLHDRQQARHGSLR